MNDMMKQAGRFYQPPQRENPIDARIIERMASYASVISVAHHENTFLWDDDHMLVVDGNIKVKMTVYLILL